MINLLLKFCYAVEIGAYLAYCGHYHKTQDKKVLEIATDEIKHQIILRSILESRNSSPSPIFNLAFLSIGHTIRYLCQYTPYKLLNLVARVMELFNIFSYSTMSKLLPEHKDTFLEMQKNEEEHSAYFA